MRRSACPIRQAVGWLTPSASARRADGKATLPTTIGLELSTNPFLRWHDPVIRRNLGMEKAADVDIFAEIRKRKDVF